MRLGLDLDSQQATTERWIKVPAIRLLNESLSRIEDTQLPQLGNQTDKNFSVDFPFQVQGFYNSSVELEELQEQLAGNIALLLSYKLRNGSDIRRFVNVHEVKLVNLRDTPSTNGSNQVYDNAGSLNSSAGMRSGYLLRLLYSFPPRLLFQLHQYGQDSQHRHAYHL